MTECDVTTKFKVGDRVKVKEGCYTGYTDGSRYNLPRNVGEVIESGSGYVIIKYDSITSPPVNPNSFELVETHFPLYSEEEAISLLTERGYKIEAPPEPLKGKVVIYQGRNSIAFMELEQFKPVKFGPYIERDANGLPKVIAIVDWTEGQGI